MNYKKVLEYLGFIDGKDFALNAISFDMLQQSRMIPEIIHHDLVPAVLDTDGVTILTEEIPAYDETVMIHHLESPEVLEVLDTDGVTVLVPYSPYVAAYDEVSMIQELFTLTSPTQLQLDETWKQVQLSDTDIALLVSEYLKNPLFIKDQENDSINIVNGNIHSWNFKNIPQPTIDELVALIAPMTLKNTKAKMLSDLKEAGKKDREMCENVLNLIDGFNRTRVLTSQQVTDMQTAFSTILLLLQANRPSSAKVLITAIVPDEILVTTEMKNLILEELINA